MRNGLVVLILMIFAITKTAAQPPINAYTVKDGRMFIMLAKKITTASLDSFITQYDLHELSLKEFIRSGFPDSLRKRGWQIEMDNHLGFVISKPLFSLDDINNPANKIQFSQKEPMFGENFPLINNDVQYGYNLFRNKNLFSVSDSIVTFYMRGSNNAKRVMLAGSFTNWESGALPMTKTDSGWIGRVKLGPGKHWYKFIVDGNWTTDIDNRLNENDGRGNMNSVFYKTNTVFTLNGYANAKKVYVAGSFNNWEPSELQMNKTSTGWELPLYLAEGTHIYRFVADGKWFPDPANTDRVPNEFNEFNSVIRIGKPFLFYLEGYTNAKQVVLTGTFNHWRRDELLMRKTATGWELPYTVGPGNYEYNFIVDGKGVALPANTPGNLYFIIQPNYTFRLKGFGDAKTVYLTGDFNGWSPGTFAMKKEGNEWVLTVHLSPGKHLYKFVVDGKWIIDPDNKLWEQNEHDTGNSVIWLEQ